MTEPTPIEGLTGRELAVQKALAKVADKNPLKASVADRVLPPSKGEDFGGTLPFIERPLDKVLGAPVAKLFTKKGVETVSDLLRHYPRRYGDPGQLTDISQLVVGEFVTVMAKVVTATVRKMHARAGVMLQVTVTDGEDNLGLTFFAKHQGALYRQIDRLRPGRVGLFTGTVSMYNKDRQLTHPEFLIVGLDAQDEAGAIAAAAKPIPLYPSSAKLQTWKIESAVKTVLAQLREIDVPDPIPAGVLKKRKLVSLFQAIHDVHDPQDSAQWNRGRRRLRYEEAFVLQSALVQRRAENEELPATARPNPTGTNVLSIFDSQLPFTLTAGQEQVGAEISSDLNRSFPMQRLLQGDVGSGKTVVALRAMLQVVADGGQAALLAPTEVLASQHARSIEKLLGELANAGTLNGHEHGTRVALLTGSLGAGAKKEALLQAASGEAGIVVGTHALLSDNVQFAELGLVIVDEQHRFGVEQRDALRAKGNTVPHLLVMTATPIPRTVAMTVFGDLEVSTLTELPAGRPGIDTFLVPADKPAWMNRTWQKAKEEIVAGRLVYVVCPRITVQDVPEKDPSKSQESFDGLFEFEEEVAPDRQLHAVEDVLEQLKLMDIFDGVKIGALHGKLPPAQKDQAMADFASGKVQLLVSTTVIEVGVDVSDASVMIILDADRFGISQLHQLRGRIGRGADRGICLLVAPLGDDQESNPRLTALAKTTDGFELAAADLELRSEGDVLGASQSGKGSSLKLLRVIKDADLITTARTDAQEALTQDPTLANLPVLARAIAERLGPDRAVFLDRS